ncbi:MAG: hypothetical protein QOE30_3198 [Mycobacterium sp.]|nr:hypothetical protein [Mycobacterium sp.]
MLGGGSAWRLSWSCRFLPETSGQQPVHIIVLHPTPIAFRIRRPLPQGIEISKFRHR